MKTKVLKDRIEQALADGRSQHEERWTAWHGTLARAEERWIGAHTADWMTAIDTVDRLLKRGEVIRGRDLPWNGSSVPTFSPPYRDEAGRQAPETEHYQPPLVLQQVLDALELLGTDDVSHTALATVGITPATMAEVSKLLARNAQWRASRAPKEGS